MTLNAAVRRLMLTIHVASSVASLGGVAAFLTLAIVGVTSESAETVRAAYIANALIAWFVILPLIFAAFVVGIIQSLGTSWGLFRHYWVLMKFLLTLVTIIVLLLQMDGITYIADLAARAPLSETDLLTLRQSLATHAIGGLVVLLVTTTLSVYKPKGMTPYGWRKQFKQAASGAG